MVALAIWQFPQALSPEQQAEMEDLHARLHEDPPAGYDVELNQAFYGTLHSAYNRFVDESRDYRKSSNLPLFFGLDRNGRQP